jgi:hypothetical protein
MVEYRINAPKFFPGKLVVSNTAMETLREEEVMRAFGRHICDDWGDLSPQDREKNEVSLREGKELISAYRTKDGQEFSMFTKSDRSQTVVMLMQES